jgi:hypothetical protein
MPSDKFPPNSRYHDVEIGTFERPDGHRIAYLRRRFVPPPETFATLRDHVVRDGERLDHVAAIHLGDPEQFWRVADANGANAPEQLTETPGRRIRITLPSGVPAAEEG